MSKGEAAFQLVRQAKAPAATANTSDLITSICDMGTCQNATAVINLEHTTNDVMDVAFWTSCSDTVCVSGTAKTATTNTVAVVVTSDADTIQAVKSDGTAITGLSVSSNIISTLDSDCSVIVDLRNIRRYLCMQYTGLGSGSTMGVTFLGRDMMEAPSNAARTAY